ncbi:MAG: macro domain-containing protein [Nanoarchaeota archaeon]
MVDTQISGVKIQLVQGDITSQGDIDAVVNAANAQLRTGGGVAGAIHRAAGPGLTEETCPLAPIAPGEAVMTGAYNLPNSYVIHCLGPIYGRDDPAEKLLADCYRNALQLAEDKEIASVAFPAISTGAFGYPLEDAARIALRTLKAMAAQLNAVTLIRMVLYSQHDLSVHEQIFLEVFSS